MPPKLIMESMIVKISMYISIPKNKQRSLSLYRNFNITLKEKFSYLQDAFHYQEKS